MTWNMYGTPEVKHGNRNENIIEVEKRFVHYMRDTIKYSGVICMQRIRGVLLAILLLMTVFLSSALAGEAGLKYDLALEFSEDRAVVSVNGKYGYVDSTGKMVIAPVYDFTWGFYEGMAYAKNNGKWGYIDRSGREIIAVRYDDLYSISDGRIMGQKNGRWGV
ncbi:MAG: hypothetical protein H6Q65_2621 [Firmicutes bacterium]|nr:hypothetical protein [Bacillota bacterium]